MKGNFSLSSLDTPAYSQTSIEAAAAARALSLHVSRSQRTVAGKIGAQTIAQLRHRAEQRLGDAFDVRRFREAVLASGSLPMGLLEEHVEWWIARELERRPDAASGSRQ